MLLNGVAVCESVAKPVKSAEIGLDGGGGYYWGLGNTLVSPSFARAFLDLEKLIWGFRCLIWFSRRRDFLRDPSVEGADGRSRTAATPFDIRCPASVTFAIRPVHRVESCHETNVSTEGAPPEAQTRIPAPYANALGPSPAQCPTP